MHALCFVLGAGLRADKVDELVAIRMERQSIPHKADPPWVFVLIREAVIRDLRRDFRAEQCKHLLTVVEHPKFSVRLIPTDAAIFQPCGFQLLSFERAPDVAYVDGVGHHGQILTDPGDVQELVILFNVIQTVALSAAESEDLIRTIMESS
jgi:hypothetical protein